MWLTQKEKESDYVYQATDDVHRAMQQKTLMSSDNIFQVVAKGRKMNQRSEILEQ